MGSNWNESNMGSYSFAAGYNTKAGGKGSFAAGNELSAPSYAEAAVGTFNSAYTPLNTTSFNSNDRVFSVGNGSSSTNRSNAMTILKSGKVGLLGTTTPDDLLYLEGANFDKSALRFVIRRIALQQAGESVNALSFHNYLSFEHDGNDIVAFSNSGRVGIGYTIPNYGTLQIKQGGNTNNDGLAIFNTSESQSIRIWADNNDVAQISSGNGQDKMALNEGGGFVGIGTDDLKANLEVADYGSQIITNSDDFIANIHGYHDHGLLVHTGFNDGVDIARFSRIGSGFVELPVLTVEDNGYVAMDKLKSLNRIAGTSSANPHSILVSGAMGVQQFINFKSAGTIAPLGNAGGSF